MADRRKREVGQIWSTTYGYATNSHHVPRGEYLIIAEEQRGNTKYLHLFRQRDSRTFIVPSKMLTTADREPGRFSFVSAGNTLPVAKPTVAFCRFCGAGDVVEAIGHVTNFHCKNCGPTGDVGIEL